MGENEFEEIFKALWASGLAADPSRLGGAGSSFQNPEQLKELLEKMGVGGGALQSEDELISQIQRLSAAFSWEKRQRIGELFLEMARQMGWEQLPPQLLEFLERWKRGG